MDGSDGIFDDGSMDGSDGIFDDGSDGSDGEVWHGLN